MAASHFSSSQYTSEQFVESSGTILFDLLQEPRRVCLIHHLAKDEWLLAKGRRNCGESRHEAALREVREETGYPCHLHPVTMSTRAPAMAESGHISDRARVYRELTEPFMLTIRELNGKANTKLIWWYIAALDEDFAANMSAGEANFRAEFVTCEDALQMLTFQDDRDILTRAIGLVGTSC